MRFTVIAILALFASLARAEDSSVLRCEPATLDPHSTTFEIRLPDPHGRELGVKTPSADFFYLAWDEHALIKDATPRIADFPRAHTLTFDPRTLEGWHPSASSPSWQRIFVESGEYIFLSGDVLQTDHAPDDVIQTSRCRVRYEGAGGADSSLAPPSRGDVPPRVSAR